MKRNKYLFLLLLMVPAVIIAQDSPPTVESNAQKIAEVQTHADYVWTLMAAFLVFLCKLVLLWWKLDLPDQKIR